MSVAESIGFDWRHRSALIGGEAGNLSERKPQPKASVDLGERWKTQPKANGHPSRTGEGGYVNQQAMLRQKIKEETTLAMLANGPIEAMLAEEPSDPRIRAMSQAVKPNHEECAGQEEADWEDVVQYWRGVGGNALRFIGLPQKEVRQFGLV